MFPVNARLMQVIEYLDISAYKLSRILNTSEAVLSNIKNGKNKPSIDIIQKILNKYEVINGSWLISGKGEMLNKETVNAQKIESNVSPPVCEKCIDKDEKIKLMQEIINTQRDLIEYLKKPDDEIGQKRKAG
jgi:transcriptional regulator with XRE-family HTH domain